MKLRRRYQVVLVNRTPRGLLTAPTSRRFWRRARAKAAARELTESVRVMGSWAEVRKR